MPTSTVIYLRMLCIVARLHKSLRVCGKINLESTNRPEVVNNRSRYAIGMCASTMAVCLWAWERLLQKHGDCNGPLNFLFDKGPALHTEAIAEPSTVPCVNALTRIRQRYHKNVCMCW